MGTKGLAERILSYRDAKKLRDRNQGAYKNLDYSQFYTSGERDINKVLDSGYGWLISSFQLSQDGKSLVDFDLRGDQVGSVYLIRAENGLTKIGYSTNINVRLSALSTESPVPVTLVYSATVGRAIDLEKTLHETFADKRQRGEWFSLSDIDIENAISIIKKHKVWD